MQNKYTTFTFTTYNPLRFTMVVFEMLRWKAPAALILAIVLLTSNSRVPQRLDVEFVECFAGDGEVSLALWGAGLKGSSHDLRYSNLMDFAAPMDSRDLASAILHFASLLVN